MPMDPLMEEGELLGQVLKVLRQESIGQKALRGVGVQDMVVRAAEFFMRALQFLVLMVEARNEIGSF